MRIRTFRHVLLSLFIVGLASAPASSQSPDHAIYATVVNSSGAPVDNLTAGDFVVREDGVQRDVLRVSPATDPIDIAVLIDATAGNMAEIRLGLRQFLGAIRDPHEVALTGIARPGLVVDYAHDFETVEDGAGRLPLRETGGAFNSMTDALIGASRDLQDREKPRRVILVIADRSDVPGVTSRDPGGVVNAVRDSGSMLYEFGITRTEPESTFEGGDHPVETGQPPAVFADGLAKQTGGRVVSLLTSAGLPVQLRDFATELNHQYRVEYDRPAGATLPKAVNVEVRRPRTTVRATRIPPE